MSPARLWPIAIVAVLIVTVAANAVLLYEASDREAAAVEPDYYRRALAWDSTLAQERRNASLGWRLAAELGTPGPEGTPLLVRLADMRGFPVARAEVTVEAIHNRAATQPVRATLRPVEQGAEGAHGAEGADGAYAAALPLAHRGLWELRFVVRRGGERFTASLRREAEGAR